MPILRSLHDALRPDGRVVLLDLIRPNPAHHKGGAWILKHSRAGQEVFRAEVEREGFELVADLTEQVGMTENYVLVFKKS